MVRLLSYLGHYCLALIVSDCVSPTGAGSTPGPTVPGAEVPTVAVLPMSVSATSNVPAVEKAIDHLNQSSDGTVVYELRTDGVVNVALAQADLDAEEQLCQKIAEQIPEGQKTDAKRQPDEVWLDVGALSPPRVYYPCARFAIMTYPADRSPLRAFSDRSGQALRAVFSRTGWLDPVHQFESRCGKLNDHAKGLGVCKGFRTYPVIDNANEEIECGPSKACNEELYFTKVLGYLPRGSGTFGGYENNWWKYLVTYQAADRKLRYQDLNAADPCNALTDQRACVSQRGRVCKWIGQNCFPISTTPQDVDPKRVRTTLNP